MEMTAYRTLAIIPARGGSKRIPRKNLRHFRGQPILAWPVNAALKSGLFTQVMVSTEDDEVAAVARSLGVDVPFMRTENAADDFATTSAVMCEVIESFSRLGQVFDYVCCIYPTAVFATQQNLRDGLELLVAQDFSAVLPVEVISSSAWRSFNRDARGGTQWNFPEYQSARTQDLPVSYKDAGQWYWFKPGELLKSGNILGRNTGSIVLASQHVQDIDTLDDWLVAEQKHEKLVAHGQY